ncbi:MAG: sulfatase [Pirellulaceae bacterium]
MFRLFTTFAVLMFLGLSVAKGDDRPNILWISCEDISPNLGCYGDPHAITPNLDALAKQGVRFNRAFTPAGVCAVVRSGVITGMYPPSIGSQHMRNNIIPPPDVKAFSEILRAAGYFCTNRSKTDYQFDATDSMWDHNGNNHKDWRERTDSKQPFFSVVNFTVSHESQVRHGEKRHAEVIKLIGDDKKHDPDKCADTLPGYFPHTPAARKDWAWYHDNITLMDQMAGDVLRKLDEDGLADDTLVVFWSDHGMGLPRGKRWIYDTGTLVPVIMRWPEKLKADSVREDLVSTMDLTPTMLSVAGIDPPKYMHGRVLIGATKQPEPSYLFFHRDRMDEVYELQRAARDRRWKYIRNYEPEKTYAQRLDYMDAMPTMQDWRRLNAEGKLTGGQKNWFAETKPNEELYDTEKDPWELTNLASLPQYSDRLARMRTATETWQEEIGDMGLIPEAMMMEEMKPGGKTPRVEPPVITVSGGNISIMSPTEAASIVYQLESETGSGKSWSEWKLYTKSFDDPGVAINAKASRAGFRESELVRRTP